MNRILNLSSH